MPLACGFITIVWDKNKEREGGEKRKGGKSPLSSRTDGCRLLSPVPSCFLNNLTGTESRDKKEKRMGGKGRNSVGRLCAPTIIYILLRSGAGEVKRGGRGLQLSIDLSSAPPHGDYPVESKKKKKKKKGNRIDQTCRCSVGKESVPLSSFGGGL